MVDVERGPILVAGATGKQGGAVARVLLERGLAVRAMTRNTESEPAKALRQKGAELVRADMNDAASLPGALSGTYGVFAVQNFWEKGVGYDGEVRQSKALADAAKQAGIKHFVQSVIADVEKPTGVLHFDSKLEVANHVREIGLPYTMLGTVFFYENFLDPQTGRIVLPILTAELRRTTRLHMMATEDVGRAAAAIFEQPDVFIGNTVNVAGEIMTVSEMREAYGRATGKTARKWPLPFLTRLMNPEFHRQLRWNRDVGWDFSLDETRRVLPDPKSFEAFLRQHRPEL